MARLRNRGGRGAAPATAAPDEPKRDVDERGVPLPGTTHSVYIAVVETFISVMEFMVATVAIRDVQRYAVETATGLTPPEFPDWVAAAIATVTTAGVVAWLLWRHGGASLLAPPPGGAMFLSRLGALVCALHAAGFAAMLAAQRWAGRDLYSMSNYTGVAAGIDMLALAPLREEVLFRGAVLGVMRKRLAPGEEGARASFYSAVPFALIHLLNLVGGRDHTATYVLLQVTLGFLIGMFYSLRRLSCGTLWEPLAMHVVNNLFSSFLPVGASLDLWDPMLGVPLLLTVALYAALIRAAIRRLP